MRDPRERRSARDRRLQCGTRGGLSRRALLGGAAAMTMAACVGDGDATSILGLSAMGDEDRPETIPEAPPATFPLGIASGDVTNAGALLWARYTGAATLHLAVWEMVGDDYGERVVFTPVTPAAGGFVHVDVGALAAGARHRYAFLEVTREQVTARSPIGRFRTALDEDALAPVTLGAVCCTYNGRAMSTLERAGERGDLDLLCLLGDTTYNDGSRTREDFRGRWAQNLSTAGYRAARRSTSVLATWDDHEITNNWNPETINATTLANGTDAFFEHLPIRRQGADRNRVYRTARWGLTAEIFVLDSRSERRPSTRTSSSAQYLSRAQMDWLKQGLVSSPATFKVILNSVPITDFPGLFDFSPGDRWEGYPAARRDILSFIDGERVDGVLWVAGDFHLGSIGRVSPRGVGSGALEVLAGPGAQFPNPLTGTLQNSAQFDFVTGRSNYTAIALDPSSRQARISYHDGAGATLTERSYAL